MLPGVTPFPPEFAARYRAKGYWEDRTIASVWEDYCRKYSSRIAVIDGDEHVTYTQLNTRATNLAELTASAQIRSPRANRPGREDSDRTT